MKLSLTTKIFLGFAVVLLSFGALSISSALQLRQIARETRLIAEGYLKLSRQVAAIDGAFRSVHNQTEQLLNARGDPATLRSVIQLARLYGCRPMVGDPSREAHRVVAASLETAPDSERDFLKDLDQRFTDIEARCAEHEKVSAALFAAIESTGSPPPELEKRIRDLEKRLDSGIKTLAPLLEQKVRQRVAQAEQSQARDVWTLFAFSVFFIVVGLAATALVGRALAPIRQLTEAVTRISRGDYSVQVPIGGRDEIGVLAREFNAMAASLRARERELSEKQSELVRAERLAAIGRVTAQITHEIRNPLSSIGLNTEMIEEAIASAELPSEASREVRELLAAISREVDRLTEITEHYLRFARLPKPVLEPWDLNAIATSILDFCAEENARASVQVVRRLGPDLPHVLADEGQVRQALLNVIRNAREAMTSGGTLTVETRRTEGDSAGPLVEARVTDTGPGISPEDQARIFDPFFSTKERGTGLGLALTQQILREHGGSVRCESQPGRGTTFVLALRATPAHDAPVTEAPRAVTAGPAL